MVRLKTALGEYGNHPRFVPVMCAMIRCLEKCVLQVKPAYLVLDAFHHGQVESHMSVTKIMADSEYLRECQDLFELYVSDYIMLTRCKVRLSIYVQT